MRIAHVEYLSKNGIRFHYSTSFADETKIDTTGPETHPWCELLFLISGHVYYYIDATEFKLSPMDVILLPPNSLHSIAMDVSQPYERMVLHFTPQLLPNIQDVDLLFPFYNSHSFAYILPGKLVQKLGLDKIILETKNLCAEDHVYKDVHLIRHIIKIAETIHRITNVYLSNKISGEQQKTPTNTQKILKECVEYINNNIKNNISAQDVADNIHLSTSYIQHLFKSKNGITLQKYILHQKMKLAHLLLSQGETPQAVSQKLGYEYYTTFNHHFKQFFHFSPSSVSNINVQRTFHDNIVEFRADKKNTHRK